jgi:ArsR family transcriptional regulator
MFKETLKFLKALADTQRLRILALLSHEELCVCELKEIIGFTMATVSQHLAILKDTNILIDRKEKKWIFYSINWEGLEEVLKEILKKVLETISNDKIILQDKEKLKNLDKLPRCSVPN